MPVISHAIARRIASEWHGGQNSHLYTLSSTGKIVDVTSLRSEIGQCLGSDLTSVDKIEIMALDRYVRERGVSDYAGDQKWSTLWDSETCVDISMCSYCPWCDAPPGSPHHYDTCVIVPFMNEDDDPSLIMGC